MNSLATFPNSRLLHDGHYLCWVIGYGVYCRSSQRWHAIIEGALDDKYSPILAANIGLKVGQVDSPIIGSEYRRNNGLPLQVTYIARKRIHKYPFFNNVVLSIFMLRFEISQSAHALSNNCLSIYWLASTESKKNSYFYAKIEEPIIWHALILTLGHTFACEKMNLGRRHLATKPADWWSNVTVTLVTISGQYSAKHESKLVPQWSVFSRSWV